LIYTQRREPCLSDRVYCLFQQPGSPKWPQQFCSFTILRELFLTKRSNFFLKGMVTFRLLRTAFTLGCSGLHILIFPLYHINRHFKFRKSKTARRKTLRRYSPRCSLPLRWGRARVGICFFQAGVENISKFRIWYIIENSINPLERTGLYPALSIKN
jgi:hypothetical protein